MPYRIIDLTIFPTQPTGNEIAEISNGGNGSFRIPIAKLSSSRLAKSVTNAGTTTVLSTDYGDVLVSVNAAVTIQLPTSGLRDGVPVSVVDIGGHANTHNILILPSGAELIIGQSSYSLMSNYSGITLWPIATGGWYQK